MIFNFRLYSRKCGYDIYYNQLNTYVKKIYLHIKVLNQSLNNAEKFIATNSWLFKFNLTNIKSTQNAWTRIFILTIYFIWKRFFFFVYAPTVWSIQLNTSYYISFYMYKHRNIQIFYWAGTKILTLPFIQNKYSWYQNNSIFFFFSKHQTRTKQKKLKINWFL